MRRNRSRWLRCFVLALIAQTLLPLPGRSAATLQPSVTTGQWTNVTGSLAYTPSECGNLSTLSAVPGSDTIIAGIARRGLWANDSGTTWSRLGTGIGSDLIVNRPSWIVH